MPGEGFEDEADSPALAAGHQLGHFARRHVSIADAGDEAGGLDGVEPEDLLVHDGGPALAQPAFDGERGHRSGRGDDPNTRRQALEEEPELLPQCAAPQMMEIVQDDDQSLVAVECGEQRCRQPAPSENGALLVRIDHGPKDPGAHHVDRGGEVRPEAELGRVVGVDRQPGDVLRPLAGHFLHRGGRLAIAGGCQYHTDGAGCAREGAGDTWARSEADRERGRHQLRGDDRQPEEKATLRETFGCEALRPRSACAHRASLVSLFSGGQTWGGIHPIRVYPCGHGL